jgi:germacradienol/geosmin synthase
MRSVLTASTCVSKKHLFVNARIRRAGSPRARDLTGAKAYVVGLSAFMPLDCGPTPPPRDPVECGLADLWLRTAGALPVAARPAFRTLVQEMLNSWVWELVNHIENRIPDPVDYIEMRRWTFGAEFGMSLAQLNVDPEIPKEIWKTRTLRALVNSAADAVGLINDIVSYKKGSRDRGRAQ